MCIRPVSMHLKDGRTVAVACHECKQCRGQAVLDWVGRNIAESRTATASHCVTLTYGGGEHPAAKVLTYSDVQKWLKLLRRHGYRFGYFCVGEYGTLKGRTHWHVVIHWKGRVPAWAGVQQGTGKWSDSHMSRGEQKVRFMHQRLDKKGKPALVKGEPAYWWPHGWTEVSEATTEGIKYAMKYIQKDLGDQSYPMPSKKPLLGGEYFMKRAENYVEAGLAPQGGIGYLDGRIMPGVGGYAYSWSDVTYENRDGMRVPLQFMLRGAALDLFLSHYVETWEKRWPGRPLPQSKLVQEFLDPGSWKNVPPGQKPWPDMSEDERRQFERQRAIASAVVSDAELARRARAVERNKARPKYWSFNPVAWEDENGEIVTAGSRAKPAEPRGFGPEWDQYADDAEREWSEYRQRLGEDEGKHESP